MPASSTSSMATWCALTDDKAVLEAPVLVRPGQAARTIAATLGYGRTLAGGIGNNVGFDVYRAAPR